MSVVLESQKTFNIAIPSYFFSKGRAAALYPSFSIRIVEYAFFFNFIVSGVFPLFCPSIITEAFEGSEVNVTV